MADNAPDFDYRRPFTRADAVAAGIDPKLLRGSKFRRIFRGVYVDAAVPDTPRLRVEAALKVVMHVSDPGATPTAPAAFASHASAARIYELPIPTLPEEHVTVRQPGQRGSRQGIRCHVCPAPDIRVVRGLPVSSPGQLFTELTTLLNLVDLVVVGDNLVRTGRITVPELVAHCAAWSGPWAVAARRAASYVRARVDSPMASCCAATTCRGPLPR